MDLSAIDVASAGESVSFAQIVPYSAIIYDVQGDTWVYVNSEALTFVRQKVLVDRIEGQFAILSEALPEGMKVVTVGVIELYGAETGVGK
jgi:hypothetical protein